MEICKDINVDKKLPMGLSPSRIRWVIYLSGRGFDLRKFGIDPPDGKEEKSNLD